MRQIFTSPVALNVMLEESTKQKIYHEAWKRKTKPSDLVREIIERYLTAQSEQKQEEGR